MILNSRESKSSVDSAESPLTAPHRDRYELGSGKSNSLVVTTKKSTVKVDFLFVETERIELSSEILSLQSLQA